MEQDYTKEELEEIVCDILQEAINEEKYHIEIIDISSTKGKYYIYKKVKEKSLINSTNYIYHHVATADYNKQLITISGKMSEAKIELCDPESFKKIKEAILLNDEKPTGKKCTNYMI